MNYKVGFYTLLAFIILIMFPCLYSIHKTLDKTDQYIVDDQITKYVDAGWMPYDGTNIGINK